MSPHVTFPKPTRGTFTRERHERRGTVARAEDTQMREARRRDAGKCRYPRCDCKRHCFAVHVCHEVHRGMGGNPTGDRTQAHLLICLCFPRHQQWDHGLIDLEPANPDTGFYSPTAFYRIDEFGARVYVGTT